MKARHVYSRVSVEADIETLAEARQVTAAVLRALRDRLTPDEADQAAAQLPRELQALWRTGARPIRQPLKMHRREFLDRVRREAELKSLGQAALAADAVFAALKEQLSEGEAEDIVAQLPRDLKATWARA